MTNGSANALTHNDERRLGVHVLSEFVYCPRAGIVALAKGAPDSGDEIQWEPWVSLSYVPFYDFAALEAAIRRTKRRASISGLLTALLILGTIYGYFYLGVTWLAIAFAAYLSGTATVFCLLDLAQSVWLAWHAVHDKGSAPDPTCREDQHVDWWAMFRADFESVRYQEGQRLISPELELAGKPWRVLRHGSMRIPVFKKRHCAKEGGHELHDQHYIRIAAYCHLLEASEGGSSPYGIVLFDDSYTGLAINAAAARDTYGLEKVLAGVRKIIASWKRGEMPEPERASLCIKCPIGFPRAHRPGETETPSEGKSLPVYGAIGRDGRTYHSACGDHFQWLPPHVRTTEKELQEPSGK